MRGDAGLCRSYGREHLRNRIMLVVVCGLRVASLNTAQGDGSHLERHSVASTVMERSATRGESKLLAIIKVSLDR